MSKPTPSDAVDAMNPPPMSVEEGSPPVEQPQQLPQLPSSPSSSEEEPGKPVEEPRVSRGPNNKRPRNGDSN